MKINQNKIFSNAKDIKNKTSHRQVLDSIDSTCHLQGVRQNENFIKFKIVSFAQGEEKRSWFYFLDGNTA